MIKYIFVGVIIILIGCTDSTFLTSDISVSEWNRSTLEFIDVQCISFNDKPFPPSKRGLDNNWDLINTKFNVRRNLLNLIAQYLETTSQLYIWEHYTNDIVNIMFSMNNKDWVEVTDANSSNPITMNTVHIAKDFECFKKCLISNAYPIYTKIGILTKIEKGASGTLEYNVMGIQLK